MERLKTGVRGGLGVFIIGARQAMCQLADSDVSYAGGTVIHGAGARKSSPN